MPGRSLAVTLSANVSGFTAAMQRAAASGQAFATKTSAYIAKNDAALSKLSSGAGLMGAAVGAGVGVAVKTFADFDQAMSNVAATGQDAKSNLDALRKSAIDAGASTVFSATEAASGIEELAKAGVSAKDSLGGGLKGALDLAAAGGVGVGEAAETAATAMTQFNLTGAQVPHIADLLAAGAGKAQGSVSDMGMALKQSGLVASQFGLSIEETTGTLGAFASSGLLGSDAGTAFKTMLLRLANPSGEAATRMRQLGIEAYDTQGKFVGITSLAEQLKTRLSGLSQAQRDAALSTIFGSDAIRAANVLYQQGGAGITDWTNKVNDAGYAARTGAERMNNLKGDFQGFTGALETAFIGMGEGANGPLRTLTQAATGAVQEFGRLEGPVKQTSLVVAAVGASGLLGAAGLVKLVTTANEAKTALSGLGISARTAGLAAGAIGLAIGVGAAAFAHYAQKAAESQGRIRDLTAALQESNGVLDQNVAKTRAKSLEDSGALLAAQKLGLTASEVTQASLGNEAAQARVNAVLEKQANISRNLGPQLAGAVNNQNGLADAAAKVKEAVGSGNSELALSREEYARLSEAQGAAAQQFGIVARETDGADSATRRFAAAQAAAASGMDAAPVKTMAASIQAQATAWSKALDKLQAYSNALLGLSGGQIGMESAIDAASDALKENGATLDVNTAKGRANKQTLNDLASTTGSYVKSLVDSGAAADEVAAANDRGRNAWIRSAVAMGMNEGTARRTARALFSIPKDIRSQIVVAGAKVSEKQARDLNKELRGIPPEQRARIVTIANTKGAAAAKKAIQEVKDKRVLAKTLADIKGAKTVDGAMKKLRDRLVQAKAKGDKRGADIVRQAMNILKGKTVNAKAIPSGEGGVRSLKSAVDNLQSKTIHITTVRTGVNRTRGDYRGGMVTPAGTIMRGPRYSEGGPVWGAGTATSDSIPAMLSNGEFVIRAKSVRAIGADRLAYINDEGRLPKFAAGGQVDTAAIMRLIRASQNPLGTISALDRNRLNALAASNAQNARLVRPAARVARANRVYLAAVDRRDDMRARLINLKRAADATKGNTEADKRYRAAQRALQRQILAVSRASREKTAATQAYNRVAGPAKAATDKLKASQQALAEQQKAVAESARQVSQGFYDTYRSTSTDARDWIDLMKQGAGDLGAFTVKILQLRKAGLSETLIQQIIGMGAVSGTEIANSILGGGKGVVTELNKTNAILQALADSLGYTAATGTGRYASGGFVSGPGSGTSDSISARLSNGEYVVNAASTARHLPLLNAVNYDRNIVSHNTARGFAGGGLVRSGSIDAQAVVDALAGMTVLVQNPWTGEYLEGRMVDVAKRAAVSNARQIGRSLARRA